MSEPAARGHRIDGPVVAVGNWEPLIFRRRCGWGPDDLEARYLREHTPQAVDRMVQCGVNLLITHYFKGFGLEGEREDIELAERLIELCHARGIRVGGYIGDTFIFETMLLEEPDAVHWVQRKANGDPVTFGHINTFRYKWCRNNPAFFHYMTRVLRRGLQAGLDMIHFDNFLNKPEPKTCRCGHCQKAFRSFLASKYTPRELKERLGFSDLRCTNAPYHSDQMYIGYGDDILQNPLLQEWVDFRCQSLADSYRQLAEFCRSQRPDVVIECNPTGIWGENTANMRSVDHARLLPHGQLFWDESPNPHGLQESGALPTSVRSMKMGQSLGNRVLFYAFHGGGQAAEIRMAEALAFNGGCLGLTSFLEGDELPQAEGCMAYVRLLQDNASLFAGTGSAARVAVYRNFASLAYNAWDSHLQAVLSEQALLQGHVPFDLVFDLQALAHDMLIVPGMECLNDAEVKAIRDFAQRGGSVILLDQPGKLDGWRRTRSRWPFEDLFPDRLGQAALGNGWVASLPAMELPPQAPSKADRALWDDFYRVVDGRFWIMPINAATLLDLFAQPRLRHARVIQTDAPPTTFVEPRLADEGKTWLVHIVNYDPRSLGNTLHLTLPMARCASATRLTAHDDPASLDAVVSPQGVQVALPNDRLYSLIVVPME